MININFFNKSGFIIGLLSLVYMSLPAVTLAQTKLNPQNKTIVVGFKYTGIINAQKLTFTAPLSWEGKTIHYIIGTKYIGSKYNRGITVESKGSVTLAGKGKYAYAYSYINQDRDKLTNLRATFFVDGKKFMQIPHLYQKY